MRPGRTRLISVLGGAAVVLVALLSAGYWWLASLTQVEHVDSTRATALLGEVRGRFKGMSPAFELRDGHAVMVRQPPGAPAARAGSTYALVWQPAEGRLSRAAIPLSLLALTTEPIPLDRFIALLETDINVDGLEVRGRDLERYGRTLLFDGVTPEGHEVLIWSE